MEQMEQHELTEQWITHHCGGYEAYVTCTCGYSGVAANIGIGCAEHDEMYERLDAIHWPLFNQPKAAPPRSNRY